MKRMRVLLVGIACCLAAGIYPVSSASGARENLAEAVAKGDSAKVNAIIASGASVDKPIKDGITPLMDAAAAGHTAVVKALIDARADVDAKDKNGADSLTYAAKGNRKEAAALLAEARKKSAGVRADASKKYKESQMDTLKKYKVSVTTEKEFRSGGWNTRDPYEGKIGIVGYFGKPQNSRYLMGLAYRPKEKSVIDRKNELLDRCMQDAMEGYDASCNPHTEMGTRKVLDDVVCTFTFEEGLLKKIVRGDSTVNP